MDSEIFEILSDPTRRQIVDELRSGEHAVGDLVDRVSIAQSGVSRHLRILSEAGFVQVRAEGQRRLYSLRPEPFQTIDRWVDDYRLLWEDRLGRMGKELEHRQQTRQRTETA